MLTDKQLEERLEYARTHTKEEWAERFGLSLATATSYYSTNRMTKRKPMGVSVDDILPLAQEHNQTEIASILGVSRHLISRCCRINGIKCKGGRRKKCLSEKNKAILEYAESHTMAETARKFKASRQWVFILKKANRNEEEEDTTSKSSRSFQLRHKKA